MAFKRETNLSPEDLDQDTQYRFKEIELAKAKYILNRFNVDDAYLIHFLIPNATQEEKDELLRVFKHPYFEANHNELVQYFRYRNLGVHKIRKFTKASPNSLVKGEKHDYVPRFKPFFKHWNPYSFIAWDMFKGLLNLFGEDLVHEGVKEQKATKNAQDPKQPSQPLATYVMPVTNQAEETMELKPRIFVPTPFAATKTQPKPIEIELEEESPIEKMRRAEAEFHANYSTPAPELQPEQIKEPEKPKLKSWEDFEDEEPDMETGRRALHGDEEYERLLADGYFD